MIVETRPAGGIVNIVFGTPLKYDENKNVVAFSGTGTTAENRMRILRLIENRSLGAGAVGYRTESLHGAGSPQAQRVMIARQGDIDGKKVLAKRIARVKED